MPDTIQNSALLFIRDLVSDQGEIINESANSFALKVDKREVVFESQLETNNQFTFIFIRDTYNALNPKSYFNLYDTKVSEMEIEDFELAFQLKLANQFYNNNELIVAVVIRDLKDSYSSISGFQYKFFEQVREEDKFHLKFLIGGYHVTITLSSTDLMYYLDADTDDVLSRDIKEKVLIDTLNIQNHLNNIYSRI